MKKTKVDADLKEKKFPDMAEIIRQGREMRDIQLFMAGMGEESLRELASQHGLSWNVMTEDERERFVDNLLHES